MYKKFQDSIQKFNLHPNDKILLAVSGGVDSMVLLHLCYQTKVPFSVAHCNFQLREEANEEEAFVEHTCAQLGIEFHKKQFDTKNELLNGSTQMVARQLRYEWFYELCERNQYKAIATAHHLNDQIETIFLNLTKGTSIKGLAGIPAQNNLIIRPLLFAKKAMIYDFANKEGITFKEDSSNKQNSYQRNKIRNQILPILKDINPNIEEAFADQFPRFQFAKSIYQSMIEKKRKQLIHEVNSFKVIYIKQLYSQPFALELFYELISPYQFSPSQCKDLFYKLKDAQTGASFVSKSHQLIKDRDRILILNKETQKQEKTAFIIHKDEEEIQFDQYTLSVKPIHQPQEIDVKKHTNNSVIFDSKDIEFPLVIRKWLPGDYFYPIGLGKKQKLKKFFINQKFSRIQKESTYLLCSGFKILWVMPYRMDDRYKITVNTKKALQFTLKKKS